MLPHTNEFNTGHRKRLRRRLLHYGGSSLQKYEKLELLLTYAIPRRDVKPLAKHLLNKFETFQNLMNATPEELCSIPGISENSAALIILIRELCCAYLEEKLPDRDIIKCTGEIIDFAKMKIGGQHKEIFMLIFLNSRNQMLNYKCYPHGTIDHTTVYAREIVEDCLANKARSVIMLHNHPSGLCLPSEEDNKTTVRVIRALSAVGITLFDHIIITGDSYHSMFSNNEFPSTPIKIKSE